MPNARRLRLHQVARELKVGQTTIIEFLEKKGVKVENSPSSIIEPAVYAILDKEFGGNKNIEKVNIREKIALKHEAVSLGTRKGSDGASEEESGFKSEVFVKSGVISVKDEVAAMSTPKPSARAALARQYAAEALADEADLELAGAELDGEVLDA